VNRGFGLIEILIVLVVVALAGTFLYKYVMSTTATVETLKDQRPLAGAKLAADVATLGTIRTTLETYRSEHGALPADKAAVLALLPAPPRFQCSGNDFQYDPAGGTLSLLINDPGSCQ